VCEIGRSGGELIWGGEAFAVRTRGGRTHTSADQISAEGGRRAALEALVAGTGEMMGEDDALSRPADHAFRAVQQSRTIWTTQEPQDPDAATAPRPPAQDRGRTIR